MKKLTVILAAIVMILAVVCPAFAADELPTYELDKTVSEKGESVAPFSFVLIEKETGAVKKMVYAGTNQDFNPARNCYVPDGDIWAYAYCFIHQSAGGCTMHPANNADPAVCFTAPSSGKIAIDYVIFGAQTTTLEFYKNAYKADAKFESHVCADPANGTDFTVEVEVVKGDKIYVALDCQENNANDETNAWVNRVRYTRVDPNPQTADFTALAAVVAALAAGVALVSMKH